MFVLPCKAKMQYAIIMCKKKRKNLKMVKLEIRGKNHADTN